MDTINVWPKENFAKFQRLVFEIRELIHRQTDRQTDRHADRNTPHSLAVLYIKKISPSNEDERRMRSGTQAPRCLLHIDRLIALYSSLEHRSRPIRCTHRA